MRFSEFRVGMRVRDKWWNWISGKVTKVTKSTVHVHWREHHTCLQPIYDKQHAEQFLESYK